VAEWRERQEKNERSLGALPFGIDDVLLPGETKQLHLYEARFLALFEEVQTPTRCRLERTSVCGPAIYDRRVMLALICGCRRWRQSTVGAVCFSCNMLWWPRAIP
jgi:hypothetical protein